jgi:hypothetical protein
MEALLHIWILALSRWDPMAIFCDDRHTPLQSIKAYFPFSTPTVRNFEEKRTFAEARNRRDDKIKDTRQRTWIRCT